jgi:hypothetical protein
MLHAGDPAAEFYDLQSSPEPKTVQQLIYEHLVHHCYNETAIEFGNHCKLNNERESKGPRCAAAVPTVSEDVQMDISGPEISSSVERVADEDDSMDLDSEKALQPHSLLLLDLRKKISILIFEGILFSVFNFKFKRFVLRFRIGSRCGDLAEFPLSKSLKHGERGINFCSIYIKMSGVY